MFNTIFFPRWVQVLTPISWFFFFFLTPEVFPAGIKYLRHSCIPLNQPIYHFNGFFYCCSDGLHLKPVVTLWTYWLAFSLKMQIDFSAFKQILWLCCFEQTFSPVEMRTSHHMQGNLESYIVKTALAAGQHGRLGHFNIGRNQFRCFWVSFFSYCGPWTSPFGGFLTTLTKDIPITLDRFRFLSLIFSTEIWTKNKCPFCLDVYWNTKLRGV